MSPTLSPTFIADIATEQGVDVVGVDGFPEDVFMVKYGDKYAAVNATTKGPDPITVNALCVMATDRQAQLYMDTYMDQVPVGGKIISVKFEEAREIAMSKRPNVKALSLWENGGTKHLHWVD